MLYLRNQLDLLNNVEARVRDPSNYRWSETEIYNALNDAIRNWYGRVSVPAIYEPGVSWPSANYAVDLPAGIDPDTVVLQFRRVPAENATDEIDTWYDAPGWQVEPTDSFGAKVRVYWPAETEYRLLYWHRNGPVPVDAITLDSELTSSATSATLPTIEEVGEAGFFQIDNEWIHYRGIERGATSTTFQNLRRGLLSSVAATHTAETPVYFCVGAPRQDLFNQLLDQARAYVHQLTLINAAPQSRDVHERMVSYFQAKADAYWRLHTPQRAPRWKVDTAVSAAYW